MPEASDRDEDRADGLDADDVDDVDDVDDRRPSQPRLNERDDRTPTDRTPTDRTPTDRTPTDRTPGVEAAPARPRWRRLACRLWRWGCRSALGVACVLALYFLAALGGSLIPVNRDFVPPVQGIDIRLLSNGVHVDFLLPVRTLQRDWSQIFSLADFPQDTAFCSHILIGWGDRDFFLETPQWADLTVGTAVRAVLWPSASALHVEYWHRVPDPSPHCRTVRVSAASYQALCEHIEGSIQRVDGASVLIPARGYGAYDNFYEGIGSYHALNTCNLWTNAGLRVAGVRTALWSPFTHGILWQLP